MNCQEVTELMQRYLDKDLIESENNILLQHLKQCPECTDMFERLQRLSNDLESLPKVLPPYSIVDSIMPRLLDIDRMYGEQSAGQEKPTVVAVSKSSKQGDSVGSSIFRSRYVSWKWMSGVVAAGIILGIFLFQQQPPLKENAEAWLTGGAANSAADQAALRSMSAQFESSPPAEGVSTEFEVYRVEDHYGNNVEMNQSMPEAPVSPSIQLQSLSDAAQPENSELPFDQHTPQEMDVLPHVSKKAAQPERSDYAEPSALRETSDTVMMYSPNGEENAPAEVAENFILGFPESGGDEMADSPEEYMESHEDSSWTMESLNMNTEESVSMELASADQQFNAMVKGNRVIILNNLNGKEVFNSVFQWGDAETVSLKEWTGHKLLYEVSTPSGTSVIVIDLDSNTEKVMKK